MKRVIHAILLSMLAPLILGPASALAWIYLAEDQTQQASGVPGTENFVMYRWVSADPNGLTWWAQSTVRTPANDAINNGRQQPPN